MTEPLVLEPSFQGEGIFHTLNTGFLRALIKKKTHTKNVEHHTHTIWSQIALCYDSLKQTTPLSVPLLLKSKYLLSTLISGTLRTQ